ncbi:MAG: RDD family protein [Woeseiaceae bacterium]
MLSYDHCSLVELYQVLNSIDAETYRDNFEALDAEIRSRQGASHAELLKCWVMLKKGRWPDYEAYLAAQIETARRREGISYDAPLPHLKYRTFWPRVLAAILDWAIFIIVFGIVALVTGKGGQGVEVPGYPFIIYSVLMHAAFGQTVGKMLAKVKVVRVSDEEPIGFVQAVMRDIVPIVILAFGVLHYGASLIDAEGALAASLAFALIGIGVVSFIWPLAEIVTMLLNEKRRAIHDFIAGTVVIRI